jgi:L-glyceraldehyde 3-phosphate reductase
LANNYGLVLGFEETNFDKILKNNFQGNLRDEIVIMTKAGYTM